MNVLPFRGIELKEKVLGGVHMLYLIAILLPPVAVLLIGKPIQAIINFILTIFFWFPGALHAILVVKKYKEDQRLKRPHS